MQFLSDPLVKPRQFSYYVAEAIEQEMFKERKLRGGTTHPQLSPTLLGSGTTHHLMFHPRILRRMKVMSLNYNSKQMLVAGTLKDISKLYHSEGWDEAMDFCSYVQKLLRGQVRITTPFTDLCTLYMIEYDKRGKEKHWLRDNYTFEDFRTMLVDFGLQVTHPVASKTSAV